jgi:hypothetical protein
MAKDNFGESSELLGEGISVELIPPDEGLDITSSPVSTAWYGYGVPAAGTQGDPAPDFSAGLAEIGDGGVISGARSSSDSDKRISEKKTSISASSICDFAEESKPFVARKSKTEDRAREFWRNNSLRVGLDMEHGLIPGF